MGTPGRFVYKAWLKGWFLWVGILSIISLNLIGILYLYWYSRMKKDPNYAPYMIVLIHTIMCIGIALIGFVLVFNGAGNGTKITAFYYTWSDPPAYMMTVIVSLLMVFSVVPLIGTRYIVDRPNESLKVSA